MKYAQDNPNTLISRFFGMHDMRLKNKASEVSFVVLENVFNPDIPLHEQYDLKVCCRTTCPSDPIITVLIGLHC